MADLAQLKKQPLPIEARLLNPNFITRITNHCDNEDYWHKFAVQGIVHNGRMYDREFILKTILDFVHPSDLIPIRFEFVKESCQFFARNCLAAILKLASNKLLIPNPDKPNLPLKVTIIANFYHTDLLKIDLVDNIVQVLKKKQQNTKLNLSEFYKDQALKEFCLFSQPKIMLYVMHLVTNLNPINPLKRIDLSYNCIKILHPIKPLVNLPIIALDLSYNEIENIEELVPLKDFPQLQELNLDGNPMCNKFTDPFNYMHSIREYCPQLRLLDNASVFCENGFLSPKQHFLCSLAGGDLVNQFIEYYFTVYDYEDRTKIRDLYHDNATFSVSCNQLKGYNLTIPRLEHFFNLDRNLCSPTGKLKHYQRLIQGRSNIMKIFRELPRTNHDPLELKCSLMYFTGKHAVLSVCGTFIEKDQYLNFMRNFVLECDDQGYCILNDQLHIHNSLPDHLRTSHKHPPNVEFSYNPLPFYHLQYREVQTALHLISGLNYEACRGLLEEYHYDLKKALNQFAELYFDDKFPPEAFIQKGKAGLVKGNGRNLSPYPPSILEALRKKGFRTSPKSVWIEINSKRIAVDYEAKERNAQKARVDNEKVVDHLQNISNETSHTTSHISNSIGNQTSNCSVARSNRSVPFPEKMSRGQRRKLRRLMHKQRITKRSIIQSSPAETHSANDDRVQSQQPATSKEYQQNQSVPNSIDIRTPNQPNMNQNVIKQNTIIEISSEESLLDSETNCITSNNIVRNDSMGLTLQSYMKVLKVPPFTFQKNNPSTEEQNLNSTNTVNDLMQIPSDGNSILSFANGRKITPVSEEKQDPGLEPDIQLSSWKYSGPSSEVDLSLTSTTTHQPIELPQTAPCCSVMSSPHTPGWESDVLVSPSMTPGRNLLTPQMPEDATATSSPAGPSIMRPTTALADQVQKHRSWHTWEPELMAQMQALRPGSKRCRILLTPTEGSPFRVTIPSRHASSNLHPN